MHRLPRFTTLLVFVLCGYWLTAGAKAGPLDRARFVSVTQSSNAAATNSAAAALDGTNNTASLTQNLPGSFWQTELGRAYSLDRIEIVAPPAPANLGGLKLRLFNLDDQVVFQTSLTDPGAGGTWATNLPANTRGRILRLGLDDAQTNAAGNYHVSLAEMRVFGDLALPYGPPLVTNTANSFSVWQSSDYNSSYVATNAVDGNTSTFTHTANTANSYWIADLKTNRPIDRVELVNRVNCCDTRMAGLILRILDGASNSVASVTLTNPGLGGTYTFLPPANTAGRYVKVGLENGEQNGGGNYYVTLAEARVFSGTTNWLSSTTPPAVSVTNNLASFKTSYMVRLNNTVPPAANANDDSYATETKVTSTTVDAYWEVDLGATYAVYGVRSIAASGIAYKLTNTTVRLYDNAHDSIHAQRVDGVPDVFDSDLNGPRFARYVRVGLENKQRTHPTGGIEFLIGFREVEVFGRATNSIGIQSFTVSTQQVATPQPVTLNWNVDDVLRAEIHSNIGSVGSNTATTGAGTRVVTVSNSTEYILIASNTAGLFTRGISVLVGTNPLPVRISEVVAENKYSLKDGDGDASDWIELRNPGNTAVNLVGYGLSDNPAVPMKWVFPATNLAPHGTLIVFASGRATSPDPAGFLHANFKLEKNGGTVVLTATNGTTTLDTITYPEQDTDLAYGRDLAGNWTFLEPTPNAVNAASTYLGWLKQPDWSHARGFYETPFTLSLTNNSPGATVLYSIGGAEPALTYSNSLAINGTTSVRARAIRPGYKPSRSQTKTFIFVDDVITSPVMSPTITTDPNYAPRLRPGLLALPTVSICAPADIDYVEQEGSIEVLWPDGSNPVQINCGIERFGNAWTKFEKRSFNMKCRARYGEAKLNVPLFNGFDRGVTAKTSFDELEFRSSSQDMWQRGFYLAARFVEDSMLDMGSLNPHGRYVHLYLNGVYWGQYDARERLDEHFLADYLGGASEDYVQVKGNDNVGSDFALGTPTPPNRDLWEMTRSNKNSYATIRNWLDVPQLTDFMLLFAYGNSESEFRCAGPIAPGTGFKFWIADSDGFLRTSAMGLDRTGLNGPGELFGGLVTEGNPDFKTLVADRIYKHYFNDGALTPARNDARLAARMAEVNDAFVAESARWRTMIVNGSSSANSSTPPSAWLAKANDVRTNLFPGRTAQMIGYYRTRGLLPPFDPPTFSQFGGLVTNGYQPALTSSNGVIYYTLDGSDPRLAGGAIAPGALVWSPGALTITNDLTLNVRVYSNGVWSALAQPQFLIATRQPPTPRDLVISEINYNPNGSDDFEFIELANLGTNLLDLSNVSLTNAVRFTFPNGFGLPPGAFVLVVENTNSFRSRYQTNASPWYWPGINVVGEWTGALDNSGETVLLVASNGTTLCSVPYQPSGDWPSRADGDGSSLELRAFPTNAATDAEALALVANARSWSSSSPYHGSPGRLDAFTKAVRISEVLAHTDLAGDWIELANVSDAPVSLTGCSLTDDLSLPQRYQFTNGTTIPPGQMLVLSQAQLGFGFSELGEDIALVQASGTNILRFLDTVDIPAVEREETLGTFTRTDGEVDFTELRANTPNATNALPRIGPVVISEIMFTPAPGLSPFLELASVTNGPTPLYDPLRPTNTWQIAGIGNFTFPTSTVLQACSTLIFCATNPAAFRAQYGVGTNIAVFGPWSGNLDPDGETLRLLRPGAPETNGFVPYYRVDHATFRTNAPWPEAAAGISYERTPVEGYANDPACWRASTANGTPGTPRPNRAPVVQFTGATNVDELAPMTLNVAAVDLDAPWQSVNLAPVQLPPGANFNAGTGEIHWTPGEAQGPGVFTAKFSGPDNAACSPTLATNSVAITVNEVNQAPAWPVLPDVRVPANAAFSFSVAASDPDQPAQNLTYAAFNLPSGFAINPNTGIISGSTAQQGMFIVTAEATDNQGPPLTTPTEFPLEVVEPLVASAVKQSGQWNLTFPGTAGGNYRVEYTTNLAVPNWQILMQTNLTPVTAITIPLPSPTGTNRFYRVRWEP